MNRNILVYIKTPDMSTFKPMSSLSEFTITDNLIRAVLIPPDKLDRLKAWAESNREALQKQNIKLQLRPYGQKSIFSI
jgi:hypothetical protein